MAKRELFDCTLQYHYETDAAICVSEGDEKDWLPKSQIEYEIKGNVVDVTMPLWLAQKKKFAGA